MLIPVLTCASYLMFSYLFSMAMKAHVDRGISVYIMIVKTICAHRYTHPPPPTHTHTSN